jgi:hypothetical protein
VSPDDRFTLEDMKRIFARSPAGAIQLSYMFAASHEDRVQAVNAAIDWIVLEHTKTAHHRVDRSEDALTNDIITELCALGFDATHDTDYGGHCDIVIRGVEGFLWMAEAKIHSSYKWLYKGLQQLRTRYSTGMPGQNDGALIIYCKGPRIDRVMASWSAHLGKADKRATISRDNKNPLIFSSIHTHERTGLEFRVRHVPISLHHEPRD